jgi:hypothetical protein
MRPGVLVALSVLAVTAWGAFVACSSALPVEPGYTVTTTTRDR